MTPFFSIIIPVYNVAPYLRECLDSVLSQTFGDWEAICVDDGSTDGSSAILDEYAVKDSRFKVIHQANAGVSAARNVALRIFGGRFILFLDADDIYLSVDVLHRLKKYVATDFRDGLVVMNVKDFSGERPLCSMPSNSYFTLDISKFIPARALKFAFGQICYSREAVSDTFFHPQIMGEDMIFMAKVFCRTSKLLILNDEMYGYRKRPGSACQKNKTLDDFSGLINSVSFWIDGFRDSGKQLTIDAVDYIALWAFSWLPGWLSRLSTREKDVATVQLRGLHRRLGQMQKNRLLYRFAVKFGNFFDSYRISCLFCGYMPGRPHFGIMVRWKKFCSLMK